MVYFRSYIFKLVERELRYPLGTPPNEDVDIPTSMLKPMYRSLHEFVKFPIPNSRWNVGLHSKLIPNQLQFQFVIYILFYVNSICL